MSSNDFTMWLHGFFELTDATELTPAQVAMIKEHLALVFNKVTKPLQDYTEPSSLTEQEREEIDELAKKLGLKPQKEKIKTPTQWDQEGWQKFIEQTKEASKKWQKQRHLTEEQWWCQKPYNNTPIADWTIRFPQSHTQTTTANTSRPNTLTKISPHWPVVNSSRTSIC